MTSRAVVSAVLASLVGCGANRVAEDSDARTAPDADTSIRVCRDFVASGGFGLEDDPALWVVRGGVAAKLRDRLVLGVAVSPDRTRLAMPRSFAIELVDIETGATTMMPVDGDPERLDWSREQLVAIIQGDVRVIDAVAMDTRQWIEGAWTDARLSPDGTRLALVDSRGLWLQVPGSGSPTLVNPDADLLLGWADDTTVLAAGTALPTPVWRHTVGDEPVELMQLGSVTDVSLSPDGRRLAYSQLTGGITARIVDLQDPGQGPRLVSSADQLDLLSWASNDSVLFASHLVSPAGHRLVVGDVDSADIIASGRWLEAHVLADCSAPAR